MRQSVEVASDRTLDHNNSLELIFCTSCNKSFTGGLEEQLPTKKVTFCGRGRKACASENGTIISQLKRTLLSLFTLFNVPSAIATLNTKYFKITCGRSPFNSMRSLSEFLSLLFCQEWDICQGRSGCLQVVIRAGFRKKTPKPRFLN
ncbi:hypothetical protein [Microcoleus sp. N9_A1]|uniref:hypothetical protein n=1 Tax=Microcoleus sp. N9_A1 TaxID=3055380 RepID=UPI002FD2A32E